MKTDATPSTPITPALSPYGTVPLPEVQTATGLKEWCVARADEWYARGDLQVALDFLVHAADLGGNDVPLLITIGSIQFTLKKHQQALASFLEASRIDPQNPKVLLHLAIMHQELGNDIEAERCFRGSFDADPENCDSSRLFAGFLMSRNRLDEARNVVEVGLGTDPRDIDLLLRLGVCYYRAAKPAAARACFQRVLQLDPQCDLAAENLKVLQCH